MKEVFDDAPLRLVLQVLKMERLAVASLEVDTEPKVTILIPESGLYEEYLQSIFADGEDESLALVLLDEAVCTSDGDSPVIVELVREGSGIAWVRRFAAPMAQEDQQGAGAAALDGA